MAVNPLISSESGVAVFAKSGAANLVSYYTFLVSFSQAKPRANRERNELFSVDETPVCVKKPLGVEFVSVRAPDFRVMKD
ncbi:hypothetical protein RRG08_064906 [Elysia crispata]|uniref:Uncharacterized protein n=1 Tax=Elysia crispata TaxID=231223 RepID=A0AAE0XSX9_9GAST|nr:hypothetical protein RRG08_064906 [Elysia crispata]